MDDFRNRTMLITLATACVSILTLVYAARAASQVPTGAHSSERKGTMLPFEETQRDKHLAPPISTLVHAKTETATLALG